MHVEQIVDALRELNASIQPEKKPAKKKAPAVQAVPAAPPKPNGHTTLNADEMLQVTVGRIVAALGLAEHGVTVESMVQKVKEYEAPFQGTVQ